jgi:hypothetical protein
VRIKRHGSEYGNGDKVDLQEGEHSVMQKLSAALSNWTVECACMKKPLLMRRLAS